MANLPPLITDLALLLAVAGGVSLLFKRFNQPLVLGYIVAGFLAGPYMQFVPTVSSLDTVKVWGEVGVIFLMFAIGLEFSLRKILKLGASPVIAALVDMACMIALGSLVGYAFGWSEMDSLFLGSMLAISSSSIIFKAVQELGFGQQRFAQQALSVSILQDIFGIVLMVVLSGMAQRNAFAGSEVLGTLLRLGFFLTLWFVAGTFLVPLFLRKMRRYMNKETLLIFSLAMCFLMVIVAAYLDYSAALGAFMMGSILAETVEAESIQKITEPVKNLFAAIFFVSVGMLINPEVLAEYWLPIVVVTLVLILGQMTFGTLSFLLAGQPPRMAIQCGFSIVQIGELSFIIASMGGALGVMSDFLYPIVVAVCVFSTFFTPYSIRMAIPAYNLLLPYLPNRMREWEHHKEKLQQVTPSEGKPKYWSSLLLALTKHTLIYSVLSIAVMLINYGFVLRVARNALGHWAGNATSAIITIVLISFFLRAIVMKKNRSIEWRAIAERGRGQRCWLYLTFAIRFAWCSSLLFYIINFVSPYAWWLHALVAVALLCAMIASRFVKRGSIRLERVFHQNINSRTAVAQVLGRIRPRYATQLRSRDVHFGWLEIPATSHWCGQSLADLALGQSGLLISAIIRNGKRINAPEASTIIFPDDRLEAIGCDAQLKAMADELHQEVERQNSLPDTPSHAMHLRLLPIEENSPFIGKTVATCGLKERYRCLIAGFETATDQLEMPQATRTFEMGDVVWLVGENDALNRVPGITTANVDEQFQ